jgi:hypothetical protein
MRIKTQFLSAERTLKTKSRNQSIHTRQLLFSMKRKYHLCILSISLTKTMVAKIALMNKIWFTIIKMTLLTTARD